MLVDGVVVEDHAHKLSGWHLRLNGIQETAVCVRDTLVSKRCFRSIGFSVDLFAA
jgi:hypothetical protein